MLDQFLKNGSQTSLSDKFVKKIPRFETKGFKLIFDCLDFIHKQLRFDEQRKTELFRRRTAEEILERPQH